jgi:hypothetical protein
MGESCVEFLLNNQSLISLAISYHFDDTVGGHLSLILIFFEKIYNFEIIQII